MASFAYDSNGPISERATTPSNQAIRCRILPFVTEFFYRVSDAGRSARWILLIFSTFFLRVLPSSFLIHSAKLGSVPSFGRTIKPEGGVAWGGVGWRGVGGERRFQWSGFWFLRLRGGSHLAFDGSAFFLCVPPLPLPLRHQRLDSVDGDFPIRVYSTGIVPNDSIPEPPSLWEPRKQSKTP